MTMTSSSPPLPLVNSNSKSHHSHTHTRNLILRHLFPFFTITFTTATILYRSYTHNDIPMAFFITFCYFLSFTSLYCFRLNPNYPTPHHSNPIRRRFKLFLWALLSCTMLGFGCSFSTFLSPPESLCFFSVVIGGIAFLYYAYFAREGDDEKGEAYASVIDLFVPIMIMFFGLGRNYLTPLLIIHAAIMNGSNLSRKNGD